MDHFCTYCSVIVGSETELRAHCNSEGHQLTIMSDEGREWKYRAPARGVGADQYTLCLSYSATGKCRLGQQCCDAHGEEELSEWKERFDYRKMKLQRAKDCCLQGRHYTEQLLEKWLTSTNPNLVMTENLDGIELSVEPEINVTVSEKNCCREWTFHVFAKATLRHVALLYETHRNHFRISLLRCTKASGIKEYNLGPHCQEWSNTDNSEYNDDHYTCKIRFVTAIYGTFRQAVVFDFGFEPVIVQKLCVDVVSVSELEKLQRARDTAVSFTERWSSNDVTVIPFENRPYSLGEQEECLLTCYPAPNGSKFTVTQSVMEPALTKNNYCARQHELLCIEEMAQYELLSRYNVKAHLNLTSCYLLTPNSAVTAKYAHNGELFANMQLSSVLSEDSASGRLVLTNCNTVLLAPVRTKGEEQRKVYEAVIEDKGKTAIYIRLSKRCTEDLKLKADREFLAEVQFQLNRLPLCEMHFAVDRLHPPSLVFPDVEVTPQMWNSNGHSLELEPRLNPKQKEAVEAIITPLSVRLSPVLIIGPFGTGKTFTLAQAVKMILNDPLSRVLVCTHSNSAADIYIREYLHPQVAEGRLEATPLRIYYRHRWVATVHPTVQQYCLVSSGSDRNFNMPTVEDVKKHRVIVTTLSTSRYLVQLGLEKGFFTHILIDEAAQAMECEAIMPLSLANENTRIVLAGDHMQLSPEVYSQFAQQRNLHTSLLERLYDLYPEVYPCKILLCENYRSHEAIIQYTSELFYDNHLQASGQQPRHKKYYPLTFFTARGEDVQDCNSTAFHNNAEVYEIVERVIELKKNWPKSWGEQDETSVGVVTPYYDQVVRIRAELRKKKLHGVSVERVLNVQGKQFRVIFLSAVRTRQTCGLKNKPESDLDHGFLSNARLLNTAITRAQSLVAVVGDPVSLCSVGKCRKMWEKFIFTCHSEKSLFGITWDSLRSQLDSMELKKNFILNPLAPEFVPGRMYHGQPNPSTTNESFCPNTAPPQPWFLFPLPTAFQGPPIIQPAMMSTPHMMSAPHPYNMVNCICPSIMPPTQHNPFQNYPYNSPPIPPPPQRPANIAARMPTNIFPRKISNSPASSALVDHNAQLKDFEHGGTPVVGRQIKRAHSHPFSVVNKPLSTRNMEERSESEEAKRILMNRIESLMNSVSHEENPTSIQSNQHAMIHEDKGNKQYSVKSEEPFSAFIKSNLPLNEMSGTFMDNMPLRNKMVPHNTWNSMPQKCPDAEVHTMSFHHNGDSNLRAPFSEANGIPNDRVRNAAFNFPNLHPLLIPSNNSPSIVEKWSELNESPQSRMDVAVPNIPALHTSFQEKLNLLEKILPPGTDIFAFVENDEQTRGFLQHLANSEGTAAAKAFLLLMVAIKKDQELIQELHLSAQKRLLHQRYSSPSRSMQDLPTSVMRNIAHSSHFARPSLNGHMHHPESYSNSEALGMDAPISPFSMPRLVSVDKIESGLLNNDQIRQDTPKHHMSNHHVPWANENSLGTNSAMIMNRHNQDVPTYEMSKLSIGSSLENKVPNGDALQQDDFFSCDPFSNKRRIDVERMNENLKRMWASECKMPPAAEQGGSPFHLNIESRNSQGSYLSRLRNISSAVEGLENTNCLFPINFSRWDEKPPKGMEAPNHMTAGPLSMSYPDIPDILSSHILPNGKEAPSKVIRKPASRSSESSADASPFLFDLSIQPASDASLRYPQLSSEGMTYAKILRSPQQ